ncbi:hypothetical protein BDQ12DRAFT_689468 [Crucibulum laeve]|uniref:Large ribosomal subunit protein uL30m n=1 Tax=Crucibulum laeve TaxID=68775 RepID=A0A5C3LP07_9AGAR|nr:hypothetical protein BDQ12DRAFT_689468 [Crucibulum laeve]
MASMMSCRTHIRAYMLPITRYNVSRMLSTSIETPGASTSQTAATPPTPMTDSNPPNTHYKITLRRSAISLGDKIKGTLISLGIHRRFQTVYHRHTPETAGKILRVKELVEVENVPDHLVKTKQQQRQERKATRGYKVVGSKRDTFMHV